MHIKLDPESLSLGDLEAFEEATGGDLMDVLKAARAENGAINLRMRDLVALVWVLGRRDNPDFTLDDARQVKPKDLVLEVVSGDRPTEAAGSES